MKKLLSVLIAFSLTACAQSVDQKNLSGQTKLGIVQLESPYFYMAAIGIWRFNNEFSEIDTSTWHLKEATNKIIKKKLATCSNVKIVDINYNGNELFAKYADKYQPNVTKGGWEGFFSGSKMPEYDLDKVKPDLLRIIQANNLDYLLVTQELHNNPFGIKFARGTYGMQYNPNVSELAFYYGANTFLMDKSGKIAADAMGARFPLTIDDKTNVFTWKKDPSGYTPEQVELLKSKTLEIAQKMLDIQIKATGLCNRQ